MGIKSAFVSLVTPTITNPRPRSFEDASEMGEYLQFYSNIGIIENEMFKDGEKNDKETVYEDAISTQEATVGSSRDRDYIYEYVNEYIGEYDESESESELSTASESDDESHSDIVRNNTKRQVDIIRGNRVEGRSMEVLQQRRKDQRIRERELRRSARKYLQQRAPGTSLEGSSSQQDETYQQLKKEKRIRRQERRQMKQEQGQVRAKHRQKRHQKARKESPESLEDHERQREERRREHKEKKRLRQERRVKKERRKQERRERNERERQERERQEREREEQARQEREREEQARQQHEREEQARQEQQRQQQEQEQQRQEQRNRERSNRSRSRARAEPRRRRPQNTTRNENQESNPTGPRVRRRNRDRLPASENEGNRIQINHARRVANSGEPEELPAYRETFHKYLDVMSFDSRFSPVLRYNKSLIKNEVEMNKLIYRFKEFNVFPESIDPFSLSLIDERHYDDLIPELISETSTNSSPAAPGRNHREIDHRRNSRIFNNLILHDVNNYENETWGASNEDIQLALQLSLMDQRQRNQFPSLGSARSTSGSSTPSSIPSIGYSPRVQLPNRA